ncbi:WXG100 family type VII secretion target [Streptomyces kronopolitis]|uniref:WXG100 family type VII secretion target n=1 Tax=Streptomyces kronopolitis TaxID=1612435 RepID=UPI0036B053AD
MSERRNPEALHEAAAGWREMAEHLDGLVRDLDRKVATAAAANWHGPAGEAFAGEWHRLKRSVDESLPAFELAAADLETAAAPPDDNDGADGGHGGHGTGHAAPPADRSAGAAQSSSGNETAYGFMALGQLANGLGGAFGKRGGGGRGQGPVVTQQWDTSTAPLGPDPFDPERDGEPRARGGEGVAKGVRSRPPGAEPPPGDARDARDPKAKTDTKGTSATAADGPPGPDTNRHGAFG